MNDKEKIAFLKQIIDKEKITQVQKSQLQLIAKELGVEYNETFCRECWRDVTVVCYNILFTKIAPTIKRKYVLRANVDVIFNGERINASTINDEKAEKLLNNNFPERFFIKINGKMK